MGINENIKNIQSNISKITSEKVDIVCVTKNRSVEKVNEAISSGITIIGENRIQEASKKLVLLDQNVEKHMIGHLQSNKVKTAVDLFDVIQSVDTLDLAEVINNNVEQPYKIFLQVNISNDPNKFGFKDVEMPEVLGKVSKLSNLRVIGLMTILGLTDNNNQIREDFRKMKKLFDSLKTTKFPNIDLKYLSMGMSDDYEIAVSEGSNMVRIGREIFE